jgi:hypothetical protein
MENNLLIKLPFGVNEEVFYLKDNLLKKGNVWRVDVEVTEEKNVFRIWFNDNNNCEIVRGEHVFTTKKEAIEFVTSTIN